MDLLSSFKFVEKKSKFFAQLYELNSLDEVSKVLSTLKKEHPKAAHICSGYVIEDDALFKNDGEVGHPGKVLLNILQEKNKTSHLLVVIRYFGGIKLGPGGVSKAFRSAGRGCFQKQ